MIVGDVSEVLKASPVFAALDEPAIASLGATTSVVEIGAGATLLSEGDPSDAAFVVLAGRFAVRRDGRFVRDVGHGEVIGDVSLLTGGARSATVTARRDGVLLRIPAAAFDAALDASPAAGRRLAARLAVLVADAPAPVNVDDPVRVVAVEGPDAMLVAGVAEGIATHLPGRRVAIVRGPVDDLAALEADRDLVLLVDGDARQADRRLVVVRPGDRLPPRAAGPPTHLVLVHGEGSSVPTGTARWLTATAAEEVHHLREGRVADLARLARLTAGRGVGLVLGGGGPRGFAHLGVMHAFEDRGVPIDAVGGTSIGSLMGATIGMGWDHDERLERALEALVRTKGLLGPTLPVVSLSSSRVVTRLLRGGAFFGEVHAEDLWLPWFAVAASLRRADMVVLDRGPVWRAIRASCSIPGVLPPVPVGDDLLVDGGVVDDLPVATMRARHGGTVIAVDLQPDDEFAAPGFDDPVLSGWRAAARWLRPAGRVGMPNLIEIVLRAKEVGGRRAQREARTAAAPDLLLRPPVGDVPALAFRAATHLVELGEAHAHGVIDALEAAGPLPWSS